jgi:hypothetical protein
MLGTNIVLNLKTKTKKNNFCIQRVVNLYFSGNSMNNLMSYCGLTDARTRASEKDIPVPDSYQGFINILWKRRLMKNITVLQKVICPIVISKVFELELIGSIAILFDQANQHFVGIWKLNVSFITGFTYNESNLMLNHFMTFSAFETSISTFKPWN